MKFLLNIFLVSCLALNVFLLEAVKSDAEKYQFYFLAHYNQLEKNNDLAGSYYGYLLKNYNSPHLYPGLLFHLAQTGKFDTILKLVPALEASKTNDLNTEMVIISAYQASHKIDEALKRLLELCKNNPDNPELHFHAASMYAENNKFTQALECIDTYLKQSQNISKNFLFHFLKAQIYLKIGNYQNALFDVKKCLELAPNFDQALLLQGMIHELSGNIQEAISNYQSTLKLLGPNPILEQQILQLQMKQQILNYNGSQFFKDALDAYNAHEYQKALQIISGNPHKETHTPSCLLTIEILCKINKVDEALSYLKKKIESDYTNDTWYRAAHLLYKAGVPTTRIIELFSSVEHKNVPLPYMYKADLYLRLKDKKNAQLYLSKSLDVTHDPVVKTRIFYQLGVLHYEDREWEKMVSVLQQGKKLNQDFPPLLNLLAFYYASKGKNLNEAELLLETALKKDKNPYFLETRALILYKKKKYDEALKVLNSLTKKVPQDSTILFRVAKTMQKKGNIQEARTVLQQAVDICSFSGDKTKYQQCLQKWAKK